MALNVKDSRVTSAAYNFDSSLARRISDGFVSHTDMSRAQEIVNNELNMMRNGTGDTDRLYNARMVLDAVREQYNFQEAREPQVTANEQRKDNLNPSGNGRVNGGWGTAVPVDSYPDPVRRHRHHHHGGWGAGQVVIERPVVIESGGTAGQRAQNAVEDIVRENGGHRDRALAAGLLARVLADRLSK